MAEGSVDISVDAGPDAVWAVVRRFAGIEEWMPGIDGLRMEGDDRVISMFGLEVRERLIGIDEGARSITYGIVEGVPVERHRATVTVAPAGSGSTVTWTVEVEPDDMLPLFTDTYANALGALAAHLA